jgi:hypothetical protein
MAQMRVSELERKLQLSKLKCNSTSRSVREDLQRCQEEGRGLKEALAAERGAGAKQQEIAKEKTMQRSYAVGLGFRVSGFRVYGLWFRFLGFRVFRVLGLGFRASGFLGLGFRV